MDINLGKRVISPDLVNLLLTKQLWQFFWYSKWYAICMINKGMSTDLIWWSRSWLLFVLIAVLRGIDILSFLYKEKRAYGVSIFIWLFTQLKNVSQLMDLHENLNEHHNTQVCPSLQLSNLLWSLELTDWWSGTNK